MKLPNLLLMTLVMALCACATESMTGQAVPTGMHPQHGAQKSACPAGGPPQLKCADTVTASFDKQGRLWIAWVDREHIYIQSSPDKGRNFSAPVSVNSQAERIEAHGEYRPKLKLDDNGSVYLTWTQPMEKRYTGQIRFSRSTDGGQSFSQPITVNDNQAAISHRFDSLAVGKHGEIFIAWLDARDKEQAKAAQQEFSGVSVYYAWSDNGGASFHANQVAAQHSCECCRLAVEMDKHNLPVLLWRQVFEGNIRDHAVLTFKDDWTPGAARRASFENWRVEACPHHGPALSIGEDGVFHAAWFSAAPERSGLFYGNSGDNGQTFSAPLAFGGPGAAHAGVLALGRQVALVWSEFDGKANLLQLQRSTDSGRSWSPPQTLASTAGSADNGFLLSDGERLYVSWQTGEGYQFKALD